MVSTARKSWPCFPNARLHMHDQERKSTRVWITSNSSDLKEPRSARCASIRTGAECPRVGRGRHAARPLRSNEQPHEASATACLQSKGCSTPASGWGHPCPRLSALFSREPAELEPEIACSPHTTPTPVPRRSSKMNIDQCRHPARGDILKTRIPVAELQLGMFIHKLGGSYPKARSPRGPSTTA